MDHGAHSYQRFLCGDDEGLVEIIRDYKDGLILFLNRFTGDILLSEELAEETFFRIVTRRPRFTAAYTFKTWLFTVGRNVALNHLKKVRRLDASLSENLCAGVQELERDYLRAERQIAVHRALDRLRPEYGQVLYLKFFEEMTNGQIAQIMEKSNRQIENLLYQAKAALRREMEKEGYCNEGLS